MKVCNCFCLKSCQTIKFWIFDWLLSVLLKDIYSGSGKYRSEKFSLEPNKIGYIFGFMIRLKQGFYYSLRTLTKTIFKKCKTVSNQVKLVNHLQQVQCSIYTLSSFYPDIFFETIYLDLDRTSKWPLLALVDSNLLKHRSRPYRSW